MEEAFHVLAQSSLPDWSLLELVELADRPGPSVSVTLVVDGVLMSGELASREAWAANLDRRIHESFGSVIEEVKQEGSKGGMSSEEWEKYRDVVLERLAFREKVEKGRQGEKELEERVAELVDAGTDWTELPAELAREWIELEARPVFTLANATIAVNGKPPVKAGNGLLRVLMRHVSAWWVGRTVVVP